MGAEQQASKTAQPRLEQGRGKVQQRCHQHSSNDNNNTVYKTDKTHNSLGAFQGNLVSVEDFWNECTLGIQKAKPTKRK